MRIGALVVLGALLAFAPSWAALPPGRAWTGIDTLKVNSHAYMVPGRFEPPREGRIELVAAGYFGPSVPAGSSHRTYGLVWADSVWRIRWSLDDQAYVIWPTQTPSDRQMLVWKTTNRIVSVPPDSSYIITADVIGDSVSPRDTIAKVRAEAWAYSGTSWGERRWVAVRDLDPSRGFFLRMFRSDRRGVWKELGPSPLTGWDGLAIAALDSTTVLVTSGEQRTGIRWGYLRDTTLQEVLPPLSIDMTTDAPSLRLRRRRGGGFWCAWDASTPTPDYTDIIEMRSFHDGEWSQPETLRTRKPVDAQHLFYQAELSAEGSDVPALAWYGYATTVPDAAYYIWTSFPTDDGPGIGERFEGSWGGINPTLVRDENGDVWLAWWRTYDGVYWSHTFTTALPSVPTVADRDHRPVVRWSLDRPAPETWWAVLRAEGDGPLTRLARLRATRDTIMSWADPSAPGGVLLRYAVRRECRDIRYQVTSADARWEPRGPMLSLLLRGANPAGGRIDFDVVGADSGAMDVRLFDVQGRVVAHLALRATGAGRDAATLTLPAGLQSGLYLLRVVAADGRATPPAKVALLR